MVAPRHMAYIRIMMETVITDAAMMTAAMKTLSPDLKLAKPSKQGAALRDQRGPTEGSLSVFAGKVICPPHASHV